MINYISDAFLKALLYKGRNRLHYIKCLAIASKERLELLEKIALKLEKQSKND